MLERKEERELSNQQKLLRREKQLFNLRILAMFPVWSTMDGGVSWENVITFHSCPPVDSCFGLVVTQDAFVERKKKSNRSVELPACYLDLRTAIPNEIRLSSNLQRNIYEKEKLKWQLQK